jgi:cytochrome c6
MSKKQKSKAMETISSSIVNGKELYDVSCETCHGTDGKLGLIGATDLSNSTLDVNAKMEIIKNGKGSMSALSISLNDEQIKAVAEYIETLRKK